MTLVVLATAWLAGIWLASALDWPLWLWGVTAVLTLPPAYLLRRHGRPALLLATLAATALGGARYLAAQPTIDANHVAFYNDGADFVTLTGLVNDEPDVRDTYTNLRLNVHRIRFADGRFAPVSGQVLVRAPRTSMILYGTELEVNGRLQTPKDNPEFSYRDYLARQGIHSTMSRPRLTVLAENAGNPLKQAIFALKARAQATITHILPDPQASLLTGILLGNDNGIPPALADDFRATGLTHIIAISGFNIAIIIAIMVSAAQPLVGRKPAVAVAMVGVTLYTILVGADASVVRAAIMGSLYLVASRLLGRPSFPYASLFLAGCVMTLANPMTLWDVGFQLSFSATLGLMLYADPLTNWTQTRLRRWLDRETVQRLMGVLSEAVLLTLAAQVITLPLMVAYFGQLSLVSLLANALVLPAQPGVMLWGGLATLAGLLVPALGQLLGWVAWLFLAYTIALVRVLAQAPYAAVPLNLSPAAILLLFAAIAGLTWLAKLRHDRRRQVMTFLQQNVTAKVALGFSLAAAVLSLAWAGSQPDGQLHVAFLDVGQGDAILITTPSGRQLLVDGGMYPSVLNEALGRQLPFWDRSLDLLVATHPDADHVAGLAAVFDRYQVDRLLTNGAGLGESDVYDAMLRAAADSDTPIQPLQTGETIRLDDGVVLTVLHPGATLSDGRNDDSVALRLTYGDFSLLLPGDLEEAGETAVMARGMPPSLVLKAGHHGANTSSSATWLTAVQPQITVISVGENNTFGHPAPEMLARAEAAGTAVLRTDQLGTIEVISDGEHMWWQAGP